ncbi:ammonium transporter Rh type A [Sitophilus oryzae]|uniref:Ammonium transporter Rh type A n=1 Tax=Sitophilus oryzae TaxID=7048 RepID=A0A6J2YQH8_SITOR|nr:ammonium transporter Rh type A [Sitophilus oryzae]
MTVPLKKNSVCEKIVRRKLAIFVFFLECILLILFKAFGAYTSRADGSNIYNSIEPLFGGFNSRKFEEIFRIYSIFQDVHVMIFIGFGYLMVFLKKYGYSSVGFNFLVGAITLQWSILCQGFFELTDDYKIEIGLMSLYRADIATAVVLISMGVVLGRTSYTQLIVMGILEIVAYSANNYLNSTIFKAVDVGGSVVVHSFGAYFGLAVSYMLGRSHNNSSCFKVENIRESSYTSDLLAMIGTIFLWLYWPSFNAIDLDTDKAYRAIINTYLSLTASCVTAFITSQLTFTDHKFNMVYVQNATLSGGVAIGASANLMVEPFGAILIGFLAGALSVFGYKIISPFIEKHLSIEDTCGVHNLHGMPGLLGGIAAIIMASIASEKQYHKTLYEIYRARASPVVSEPTEYIHLEAGDGRTAGQQAGYQTILVLVTIVMSVFSGFLTGFIMNFKCWNQVTAESFYDDAVFWNLPKNELEVENLKNYQITVTGKLYNSQNILRMSDVERY